jgi:hypothetical protein
MTDLKILSITGKPGLYKMLTSTKAGIIAESLTDKKRAMAPFTSISALDEIAIYTYEEEIPLWEVFQKIADKEDFKEAISHKSSKTELEKYLREVLPEFDEDRVYTSHIKKIIQWYNLLQKSEILKDFLTAKEEERAAYEKAEKEKEEKKK